MHGYKQAVADPPFVAAVAGDRERSAVMTGRPSVGSDAHLEHTGDHLRTGDFKVLQIERHLYTIVQGGLPSSMVRHRRS
jgi:hypothetical protein